MKQSLEGMIVCITEAGSELGAATARLLAAQGASVVVGARSDDHLQPLVNEIHNSGGKTMGLVTDVTCLEQVEALVDAGMDAFGGIDVLINNASVTAQGLLEGRQIDDWNRMIDVNVRGVLHGIAAVLPLMQDQQSGHIINVASVAGRRVGLGRAVHAATKAAVRALSEGLRQEAMPYNVRTTVIALDEVTTGPPNSAIASNGAGCVHRLYTEVGIPASCFAQAVVQAIGQPDEVDVEILFRSAQQDW